MDEKIWKIIWEFWKTQNKIIHNKDVIHKFKKE